MNKRLEEFKDYIGRRIGEIEYCKNELYEKEKDLEIVERDLKDIEQAQLILSEAIQRTQTNVQEYVETLTTEAIQNVYDDDSKFLMEFDFHGTNPKCTFMVQQGEWEPFIPKRDDGGGIIDIISIALRVVFWSMEEPRTRAIFYLDEPFKWVGAGDSPEKKRAIQFIREVHENLGIQFIINTHESTESLPEITTIADKVLWVTKDKDKISRVWSHEPSTKPKKKVRRKLV